MKLKILPILFSLPTLSGCMTYSESFDCPPGKGVGCKSLNQVNEMVDKGDLSLEKVNKESTREDIQKPKNSDGWIETKNAPQSIDTLYNKEPKDPRTNLRIWVAGHKDEEGNYYSPSYIYTSLDRNFRK